jgi:D-apiose dehydrogenase
MTVRIALIGCGFFARNHMQAWAGLPGVTVVAVCDRDPERADRFAADFGARTYTDAAGMLAEVRPDICDIATTVETHRNLVECAAPHARLILCQKPFAETLADARAMVAACDRAGSLLMVHENFRWQRPYRELAARLAMGAIGAPRFLRLSFRHGFDIYRTQPYLAEVPDLALTDVGLHLFDMVRALVGDATGVFCQTQRRNPAVRGMDAFTAQVRHPGDLVTSVECSFFSQVVPDPFPQTLAWVEGETGTLEVAAGYRLILHKDGGITETDVEPAVPAWGARPWHGIQDSVVAFQAHALDVLAGRAAPQPSGAHNLGTLALVRAAIRSAAEGRLVTLDEILGDPAA